MIAGCYSIPDDQDQIRIYPREPRLSNTFMTCLPVSSQILLIDSLWDKLIVFCADGKLNMYTMVIVETDPSGWYKYHYLKIEVTRSYVFFFHFQERLLSTLSVFKL